MSFQTPGGPAAKRRRVEAANATLRKPFRSPLISRQQQNSSRTSPSTPGFETASPTTTTTAPRTPATPAPARSTAISAVGAAAAAAAASPLSLSPSPVVKGASAASEVGGDGTTTTPGRNANTPAPPKLPGLRVDNPLGARSSSSSSTKPPGENGGHGGGGDLLQRINASQREIEAHTVAMQKQLEIVRQAARIEKRASASSSSSSSHSQANGLRGGKWSNKREIDGELRELVEKWKGASRLAAEELFGLIKGRVEQMGGGQAWRESRRRQVLGGGFGDADEVGIGRGGIGNGDEKVEEGWDENGEVGGSQEEEEVEEEENGEVGFTMLMMLRSLNIDPDVLGYDPVEDKWRD